MRIASVLILTRIRRCEAAVLPLCCLLIWSAALLSNASGQTTAYQTFTYDAQGNLVTQDSSANVVAPVIVANPVGRLAQIGGNVSFSVVVNGSAPLTYQWRFNNTPISTATNPSAGTATLILNGLTAANLGNKWNFEWITTLTFDSNNAYVNSGQSGVDTFAGYTSASASSGLSDITRTKIVKSGTNHQLVAPDIRPR